MADCPSTGIDSGAAIDVALSQARDLRARRCSAAACAAYDSILAIHPENREALSERGLIDYERGQFAAAAARMEEAARLAPQSAIFWARCGAARLAQGRLTEARDHYRQALALDTEQPELLWHFLGNIHYELGEDAEAARAFRQVLAFQADAPGALNNLANALCNLARRSGELGAAEEAVALYRRVRDLDPAFPGIAASLYRALIERARLLLLKEDGNRALDACRAAIRERDGKRRATLLQARSQPSRWHSDRPLAVRNFTRARVLADETGWCVLAADNALYADDMSNANPELGRFVKLAAANGRVLVELDAPHLEAGACFLLGGSRNYYHWLMDYFPRLGLVDVPAAMPLLINADLAEFQRECLERVGIAPSRLLPVALPAIVDCAALTAPLAAAHRQRLHPQAAAWLRQVFLPEAPPKAAHRLYVSRRDAALRRIVNEDELVAALAPLGFDMIVPGMMSVAAQAAAFSQADIILGAHGAGLVNMIFAPPGARIVELSAGLRFHPAFMETLARGLGQSFTRLQCAPLPAPHQRGAVNAQDHDMIVPLPELLPLLAAVAKA